MLVMDNASFHRSERVRQMCDAAGVKLLYLPPYSPDLNPVEEWFSQLKGTVKRDFLIYEKNPDQGFKAFLERCVDMVREDKKSARGHFRHAGWTVEEPEGE